MDLKLIVAVALSVAALVSLAAEQQPTHASPVAPQTFATHVGAPTLRPQLYRATSLRVPLDAPQFDARGQADLCALASGHPLPASRGNSACRTSGYRATSASGVPFVPGEPWRNWAKAWYYDGPFPVARAAVRVTARNWPGPIACWWRCRLRCR